ncbi:hypothetical protein IMY05_C2633000300 [Salix suchowensis]|nr:hypothetical protein IMY05_C2633000300 [Salix suchowensis]
MSPITKKETSSPFLRPRSLAKAVQPEERTGLGWGSVFLVEHRNLFLLPLMSVTPISLQCSPFRIRKASRLFIGTDIL